MVAGTAADVSFGYDVLNPKDSGEHAILAQRGPRHFFRVHPQSSLRFLGPKQLALCDPCTRGKLMCVYGTRTPVHQRKLV